MQAEQRVVGQVRCIFPESVYLQSIQRIFPLPLQSLVINAGKLAKPLRFYIPLAGISQQGQYELSLKIFHAPKIKQDVMRDNCVVVK